MPRATTGSATHRRKVRVRRQAAGFRGSRKLYRLAMGNLIHAGVNAYRHRRLRRREFRSLWIVRLSAACASHGIQYSRFINGLKLSNIIINRKMLSELAIHDPAAFEAIVKVVKAQLSKQAA